MGSYMELLPEKTVERLSQYRRSLQRVLDEGKTHIYSHEIAKLLHITPVQVRRDIMLIGHTGTLRKGYDIKNLIGLIGEIIDCSTEQRVAIVGVGKLGQALLNYLSESNTKLKISALFDNNPDKIGRTFSDIVCYSVDRLDEIIRREKISIAILTVPPDQAHSIKDKLLEAGILGIINYSPVSLNVEGAFLEEYDVITSLEKVAYFAKPRHAALL
jgi:redox-sensing transcriptional repressor